MSVDFDLLNKCFFKDCNNQATWFQKNGEIGLDYQWCEDHRTKINERMFKDHFQISLMCETASLVPIKNWPEKLFLSDIFGSPIETEIDNNLIDLLVRADLCSSKRRAREDLTSGAVRLNGEKLSNQSKNITKEDLLFNRWFVLSIGKFKHRIFVSEKF